MRIDRTKILNAIPIDEDIKLKGIIEKCGYSPRSCQRAIKDLINKNLIIASYDFRGDLRGLKYRKRKINSQQVSEPIEHYQTH